MKKLHYKRLNAFTSKNSKGNPAAYFILDNQPLLPKEMLAIGREFAGVVSEVVFCEATKYADVKLTYYSSECEVDFCGHGTIATMYDMISNNKILREKPEVRIETNRKGILTVYNNLTQEDAVYITAPKANMLSLNLTKEEIASALGIEVNVFDSQYQIDFIDAGLRTLLVPIQKLEREISIYPNEPKLKQFCLTNGIDNILIFCKQTKFKEYLAHTRVFAPKFGYLEDPATGSGNSAFANYLLKYNLWDGTSAAIEQGGDNIEFNPVRIKTNGTDVLFGGRATVEMEDDLWLDM